MIIAHLSDLHVSRFGSRLTELKKGPIRAARGNGWEVIEERQGWRVEARRAENVRLRIRDALRLVDDEGVVHALEKVKKGMEEAVVLDHLYALQDRRLTTSQDRLAADFPDAERAAALLAGDPDNGNLRFCALAHTLRAHDPDHVIISGDLTDDGVGYALIEAGLAPFIQADRLTCVPGNHDIYPSPPVWTDSRLRKSESDKRQLWAAFATRLDLPSMGSYVRPLGDGVDLICLDSAHPPAVPGSASGIVLQTDIDHVTGALAERDPDATRLVCLHHHVINLPTDGLGLSPFQPGMRLRNARAVYDWLRQMKVAAVLNGHRHIGYRYQPAEGPLFVSAPSTTAGCRSGAAPFYWRLEVDAGGLRSAEKVGVGLEVVAEEG